MRRASDRLADDSRSSNSQQSLPPTESDTSQPMPLSTTTVADTIREGRPFLRPVVVQKSQRTSCTVCAPPVPRCPLKPRQYLHRLLRPWPFLLGCPPTPMCMPDRMRFLLTTLWCRISDRPIMVVSGGTRAMWFLPETSTRDSSYTGRWEGSEAAHDKYSSRGVRVGSSYAKSCSCLRSGQTHIF